MAIRDVVISDVDGALDTKVESINLANHFTDGRGEVTYMVSTTSPHLTVTETDGILSVALKGPNVPYSNQTVKVTASDGTDTVSGTITVRRNQKPKAATIGAGTDEIAQEIVAVGTQYPHDTATCSVTKTPGPVFTDDADDMLAFKGVTSLVSNASNVMIDSAEGGIMVKGIKSSWVGTTATPISIDVTATDSGMESITRGGACGVHVDAAPKVRSDSSILGNVTLSLFGTTDRPRFKNIADAHTHFEDTESETLAVTSVKSSDTAIATAVEDGTTENTVVITAIAVGTATITVTVTEADGTSTIGELGYKDQTATATFEVLVVAGS